MGGPYMVDLLVHPWTGNRCQPPKAALVVAPCSACDDVDLCARVSVRVTNPSWWHTADEMGQRERVDRLTLCAWCHIAWRWELRRAARLREMRRG